MKTRFFSRLRRANRAFLKGKMPLAGAKTRFFRACGGQKLIYKGNTTKMYHCIRQNAPQARKNWDFETTKMRFLKGKCIRKSVIFENFRACGALEITSAKKSWSKTPENPPYLRAKYRRRGGFLPELVLIAPSNSDLDFDLGLLTLLLHFKPLDAESPATLQPRRGQRFPSVLGTGALR